MSQVVLLCLLKKKLFCNCLKFKLGFGLYNMLGICESYALGDVELETKFEHSKLKFCLNPAKISLNILILVLLSQYFHKKIYNKS